MTERALTEAEKAVYWFGRAMHHCAENESLRALHDRDLIQVREAHEARRKAVAQGEQLRDDLVEADRSIMVHAALLAEAKNEVARLQKALRWCGDHGDNGCWEKANEVLGKS